MRFAHRGVPYGLVYIRARSAQHIEIGHRAQHPFDIAIPVQITHTDPTTGRLPSKYLNLPLGLIVVIIDRPVYLDLPDSGIDVVRVIKKTRYGKLSYSITIDI